MFEGGVALGGGGKRWEKGGERVGVEVFLRRKQKRDTSVLRCLEVLGRGGVRRTVSLLLAT